MKQERREETEAEYGVPKHYVMEFASLEEKQFVMEFNLRRRQLFISESGSELQLRRY